jgi:hypothetical protein
MISAWPWLVGSGQVLEGLHKPSSVGKATVWLGRQAKRRRGRLFLGLGILGDDGRMVVKLHESLLLSISSPETEEGCCICHSELKGLPLLGGITR